jgi:hypothetical protein
MDIKTFAAKINGFEYPAHELKPMGELAREHGFLFIYGMSDDLLEMGGIIEDELGAWDGLKTKIGTRGVDINAVWSPVDKPMTSWEIKADCEHETFHIMEDGDIFCIGVVIHKSQLDSPTESTDSEVIAQLTTELAEYKEDFNTCYKELEGERKRADGFEGERDALIAALQRIEQLGHGIGHGKGYTCANIAEDALANIAKEESK